MIEVNSSRKQALGLLIAFSVMTVGAGFNLPSQSLRGLSSTAPTKTQLNAAQMEPSEIKTQLKEYLEKREALNADELAEQEKGKVIGGTKGNKVLEYISGAPAKEQVIERAPNIFDYDELTKYGYGKLVTPIMELGGRKAVYELMDMEAPALPGPGPKKKFQKLVIDRTGENDKARYTGLKMGQVIDDDMMAEALERANKKAKEGKELRPKLLEEEYVQPFAEKRNIGPQQTPDWTVERLDEYTKRQGSAVDWARRAKEGEFVSDPSEVLSLPTGMKVYATLAGSLLSFAFGRSTPTFLQNQFDMTDNSQLLTALQVPALALFLAGIGSSIYCAVLLAPERNRNGFVWGVKGFLGGPLAIQDLRSLNTLITRGEQDRIDKKQTN